MPPTVIVLGVFNADTTYRAPRLPRLGETLLGTGFALGPGGKGSNQAVAAARAGADTALVTRLGDDAFAAMARALWAEAGVTALAATDPDRPTGAACILVEDGSGDNAIVVAPGAGGALGPADLDAHAPVIAGARVFLASLEQPLEAALHGLRIARAAGLRTILNPAPAPDMSPDILAEMLALADILTPNATEAAALAGHPVHDAATARAAAETLRARGAGAVIVTLGAQGALLVTAEGAHPVAPRTAGPVVETTGAGDAFNGALAAALAEGRALADAADVAAAAAALCVTRPGTARAMPARSEIDALRATSA